MISRFFKRETRAGSIDRKPEWPGRAVKGNRWDTPLRSDARTSEKPPSRTIAPPPPKKRARLVFLAVVLACVPAMVVATVAQFRVAAPLERTLMGEEIRGLVAGLDAMIDVRSSAVKMSAGTLEIENLSASGELNRILNSLKELFPDFLSMEICNAQGQTLAMMGDLSLSRVGRKADFDGTAKPDSAASADASVFSDDPADHAFSIILKHRGTDGSVWFTRTRFARDPLDAILKAYAVNGKARLVSLSHKGSGDHGQVATAEKLSHEGAFALTANRKWWPTTLSAAAPLTSGGWMVSLEKSCRDSSYLSMGLIVPGVLLLVSALACLLAEATSRKTAPSETVPVNGPAEQDLALPTTAPPYVAAHIEDDLRFEEFLAGEVLDETHEDADTLSGLATTALAHGDHNPTTPRAASPRPMETAAILPGEPAADEAFLGAAPSEDEFGHRAEAVAFPEDQLDPWEPEPTIQPIQEQTEVVVASRTRQAAEACESLIAASDESIPESLEVTWFEPDPEAAQNQDPPSPSAKKRRQKTANNAVRFVSC